MDGAFLMAIAVWVSGAGFGWLWRHYSYRHYREAYSEGWKAALRYHDERRTWLSEN